MPTTSDVDKKLLPPSGPNPGDAVRTLRKRGGLTLSDLSQRTGLAISTLSKVEKGRISLSYDKLMLISKGLGIDIAQLLDPSMHQSAAPFGAGGRRVVHRRGEGQVVETKSYKQLYLATEMLQKRFTPLIVELRARTMDEFKAEFGDFIRHPGEEFALVLQGEVEFHTELYAPLRLKVGDSFYFDSEMGHAYLKASEEPCIIVAICSPRGSDDQMIETFSSAADRLSANVAKAAAAPIKRARAAR